MRFDTSAVLGDRKKVALSITAVVALVLALTIWMKSRPGAAAIAPTNDFYYICKHCDNHFGMSNAALNSFQKDHYGEPLPCPKCGSTELIHAIRCTKCGEIYPEERGGDPPCPKCGHKPSDPS
jgi:DNA-directed RNA polymerase subunit RPC12/RpoP